ncbi:MAG: hypothetical protein N3F04_00685 [Candidatus Nezhaarchaeota archaeon]|nr:hypothetical protein [Candidatus Nezhaarchaeota archaeon]MCX8141292.1 hypothetical protein [Candidatus Nezhaarchaeota archaeon]MDW8049558.1 hypothetical protein [Nitrososphaerota archaeon]
MPSWRAHRNITKAVLKSLGPTIPGGVINGIMDGIIDPDKNPDKVFYVTRKGVVKEYLTPHHAPIKELINYYFELSLYHFRWGDGYKAGFMLGRALHYVQDGSLTRRRYLILDVHEAEEKTIDDITMIPQRIEDVCRGVSVEGKKRSSRAIEAVCIALRESKNIVEGFVMETQRIVDVDELRKRVKRIRLAKLLTFLAFALPTLVYPLFVVVTIMVAIAVMAYKPRTYHEAMKAGIMIVKPFGVITAY